MTVDIYHVTDDDYERIAVFENGNWEEGEENISRPEFYEGAPEEVVLNDFDGPQFLALDREKAEGSDVSKQVTLGGGR
jgi:hypothetical protein